MKRILLIVLILTLATGIAMAERTAKALKGVPEDGTTLMPKDVTAVPLPAILDSPGELIGVTTYDYQTNGPMGNKIAVDDFGGVHVVWTEGEALAGRPRHVNYNFKDENSGVWSHNPDGTPISTEDGTGFITMDLTSDGRAFPAFHSADATPSHSNVAVDAFRGFGIFDIYPLVPNGGLIWPYISKDINDRYHLIATLNQDIHPINYTYSTDEGATWAPWEELPEPMNILTYVVASSPVSAKTAIAFIDDVNYPDALWDVYYLQSDDGVTWDFRFPENLTQFTPDDSTSAFFDIDAIYDYNDNLHIVYSASAAIDGGVYNFDSYIGHWSLATGITTFGFSPDTCASVNYCLCESKPNLGVDTENNIFCVWSEQLSTDMSLAGYSNGELLAIASQDGGATWNAPVNITNSPSPGCAAGDCDSDVWMSLADKVDEFLHVMYIDDGDAGAAWNAEGTWTENPVLYLAIPASNLLGIEEGQVELPFDFKLGANYPNPFNAETIIPLEGEVHQGNVTIYDIAGRQIKDFAINENTYQIQWDGTNSAGKTVASGTYFYSVSFDGIGTAATKKMTLLK
jgi:hypothetical protein